MPILLPIDSHRAGVFEVQATTLAVIAWPEEVPEGSNLAAAHVAFGGHLMRAAMKADVTWAHRPQWLKPVYLLQGAREVDATLARAMDRLRRALQVARIARPFVAEVLGAMPALPADLPRLSLNKVTEWVLDASGEGKRDAHKFEEVVVRRTYPVLHLALALERVLDERRAEIGEPASLEKLMMSEEACRMLLDRAEALEPVMLSITRLKVSPDTQIRIRLVTSSSLEANAQT